MARSPGDVLRGIEDVADSVLAGEIAAGLNADSINMTDLTRRGSTEAEPAACSISESYSEGMATRVASQGPLRRSVSWGEAPTPSL